jgi:hypothetical protein
LLNAPTGHSKLGSFVTQKNEKYIDKICQSRTDLKPNKNSNLTQFTIGAIDFAPFFLYLSIHTL